MRNCGAIRAADDRGHQLPKECAMATRTAKQAEDSAFTLPSARDGGEPPGAVETAIAAATAQLLPAPRDDEAVRRLAYSYYEERGRADGYDLEDWLKAEAALGSAGQAEP
jgi:hypothetical protein